MISGFKEVSRNKEGMKKKKNKNEQMMKKDGRWSQGNWRVESLTDSERQRREKLHIQGESTAAHYAR